MGCLRASRDYEYTERLALLRAETLHNTRTFDSRLLCFVHPWVKEHGVPFLGEHAGDSPSQFMQHDERRYKGSSRHRSSAFIASNQREAFIMNHEAVARLYPQCPPWWSEYEVPYSFCVETPPWELLHSAHPGRLCWLPVVLTEGIRQVGTLAIICGDGRLAEQLESLLLQIELLRWSRVDPANRTIPEHAHDITPVYDSGSGCPFRQILGERTSPRTCTSRATLGGLVTVGRAATDDSKVTLSVRCQRMRPAFPV